MPEILSDNGHDRLSPRPPERSQLASPLAPWSRRLDRLTLLRAPEASCVDSGEMHEDILSGLAADKAVAFGIVKPLYCPCSI